MASRCMHRAMSAVQQVTKRPWLGVVTGQGLDRAARGVRQNSVLRTFHNASLGMVKEASLGGSNTSTLLTVGIGRPDA